MNEANLVEKLFYPNVIVQIEYVVEKNIIRKYTTRVEDLETEYLILQTPISDGEPVLINEGRELTLRCEDDKTKQAYLTSVFVVENRPGEIPLLVCCKPREINKTSLRRYSRFTVDLPCTYTAGNISAYGRVTEISLTGCLVIIDRNPLLGEGTEMKIAIKLSADNQLDFSGEVVRIYSVDSDHKIGIALDIRNISPLMRNNLKDYIFNCQLMN